MDFSYMKDFMDRLTSWRIPGNSVSIYKDGREVFRYSSGYADLENRIPMTGDELLYIYSCSKITTVTAALQLYEKGLFLLDDPLYDIIPEYGDVCVKDDDGNIRKAKYPITIGHLFSMTSGLTYNTNTPAFEKARRLTDGKMDTLTVIKCLAEDPLAFDPGERWNYSLSHDVLAAVVEAVSGKRFSDYVRENIFEPLDMKTARYHSEDVPDRMATQYRFENGGGNDIVDMQKHSMTRDGGRIVNAGSDNSLIFGPMYDSGGAGITVTVGDYAKFTQALARKGLGINGERILADGTFELLRTDRLTEQQRASCDWRVMKGYGFGLGVKTLTDRALAGSAGHIGEIGWGGAAGSTFIVDADAGLSLFYAHHMLNPHEEYYQPRLRNVLYACTGR